MTHSNNSSPVSYLGAIFVLAALSLAGCNRNTEPAAATPPADASGQSAEYATPATGGQAAPAGASLQVTVSLSPAVAKKAAPNDVVFIFARAAQGPRMPLAIVRKQVKDLPATVALDDSSAMSPEMSLSSVPEVIVIARVSKSGMANAQPGDLEGTSGPVKSGTRAVSISIANVLGGP